MWFLLAACAHPPLPDMAPSEVVEAHTDDGWTLPIYHHAGPGRPVLLVHGMAANHYNWDWRREHSLAAWLQERGWDVWVPALRGDVDARGPSPEYSFDDHAEHDVPAILDAVRAATGEAKVAWVGHSMGGMLFYTTSQLMPERVSAAVVIGSPVVFEDPTALHVLARDNPWAVAGRGVFPTRDLARGTRALGGANAVASLLAEPGSIPQAELVGLTRDALSNLPRAVARQANTWLRVGELAHVDGSPWMTHKVDVPLLAVGMGGDRLVPWWYVQPACRWTSPCSFRLLGRAGGFSRDYGHIDPVLTADGARELYPLIGRFLDTVVP
jgi:pimeloyl-ACP methyl ester carboxylesterase